jgi:hypothetical protein
LHGAQIARQVLQYASAPELPSAQGRPLRLLAPFGLSAVEAQFKGRLNPCIGLPKEVPMRQVLLVVGALLFALTLAPAAASAQAHAQNGFSLGLVLGDPTGVTLRGGLGERHAIQAHFGFSPFPGDAVVAMVDWTYDAWDFLRHNTKASLLFYFGAGGKAEWFTGTYYAYEYDHHHSFPDKSHFGLGVRGLVGLRASFRKAPFDLFFELAPVGVILVVPNPGAYYDVDLAIGARYRF